MTKKDWLVDAVNVVLSRPGCVGAAVCLDAMTACAVVCAMLLGAVRRALIMQRFHAELDRVVGQARWLVT